jgi:hypothetical protein
MPTKKFLISLALAVSATRLSAAITSYPDRATMEAAVPLLTFSNISFAGAVTGDGTFSGGITDTTTGVQFFGSSNLGSSANLTIGTIGSWSQSPALQEVIHETIHIVFPANIFAFGGDLIFISGSPAAYEIDFIDTAGHSITTPVASALPGSTFFGVRSGSPIMTADIFIQTSNAVFGLDNLDVGTVSPTPEIATFLMIGAGLIILRIARRWMPPGLF